MGKFSNNWLGWVVFVVICFVGGFVMTAIGVQGFMAYVPGLAIGTVGYMVVSLLSSNRSVANASSADRAAALASPAPAGSGLVYVYRDSLMGMALGFDVALDGVTVAQLKSPRFTRMVVPAGLHTLTAGPKGFAGTQNKESAVSFALADRETATFRLTTQMGMVANSVVVIRDPDPRPALAKFASMTMVMPEATSIPASAMSAAAPPPPRM